VYASHCVVLVAGAIDDGQLHNCSKDASNPTNEASLILMRLGLGPMFKTVAQPLSQQFRNSTRHKSTGAIVTFNRVLWRIWKINQDTY